jgi:hypothetical protein
MANYGITLQGCCQNWEGYGNYPINGKKPGSLRQPAQNVLKIRDLGVFHAGTTPNSRLYATFWRIFLSCQKNTMHTLLLSLPGGAEWILIVLVILIFIATPVIIGLVLFRLLRSGIKSAIRETIEEMKAEGRL